MKKNNPIESFFKNNSNTLTFISVFIGLILLWFTISDRIDKRVENKINDDKYIATLSKSLRPFLVFDENEKVIYDHGGLKYINGDSIKITEGKYLPEVVTIKTNVFLNQAPLLNFIGSSSASYKVNRSETHKWEYKLSYRATLWRPSEEKPYPGIFTLEILK